MIRLLILLGSFFFFSSYNIPNEIYKVDIEFRPSFHMKSIMHLDKKNDLGTFAVRGIRKKLIFSLSTIDSQLSIMNFFNESFIKSLPDTTKTAVSDGMGIVIRYRNNNKNVVIDLGNFRPKETDSIFLNQIHFLETISADLKMNAYLKDLIEYF